MDKIDLLLEDAWFRLSERARRDRLLALRRSRRRFGILSRPMRAWCLCLRASDTRINNSNAPIDPFGAVEHEEEHEVLLTGDLIRHLTKPVMIDWPGLHYEKAAEVLGREVKTVRYWACQGVFQVDYYRAYRRPVVGRPRIWTPSPIDPNAYRGRVPHAVWGTLWQWMWERMPTSYSMVVRRVPRYRFHRGRECFRGWHFICPGRLDENDQYKGCGRRCTFLYGPQSVWTLAQSLGDDRGFEMPADSGLAGRWVPGFSDPIRQSGPRSFACKHCWKVRGTSWADATGWNEFISYVSGGLLYGRDVPRPPDLCPAERRVAYKPRPGNNDTRYATQRARRPTKEQQRERRAG